MGQFNVIQKLKKPSGVGGNSNAVYANNHTHGNKELLDLVTQSAIDVLSHLSIVDGRIKVSADLWSTGELSAYGDGAIGGGGASGSLGGLVNVGVWADEVPSASRIMVQMAGSTHWSSKLLSEVVGLDTIALGAYLSTNKYTTETYVNDKIAALVGSSPATLDTLNELATALGNDPNFATSMTTLIGTKWTQDNTKISNWDSAFGALHTHSNKGIIDSLTQANLDVLARLSVVDGNLKVDTNFWSTGEVSAYGAGSGTGGGSGLISSVLGSAGLGGGYLDSDLTNTFNAYTINLINGNLTSALGRIGALETSTPNVAWGTPTSQYSPLTINSVTRNLSLDGHTHSYLPLSGGNLTGGLTINSNTVWHAGNDGTGSGLDADLLDGLHNREITARALVRRDFSNIDDAMTSNTDYGLSQWSGWSNPITNGISIGYNVGISVCGVDSTKYGFQLGVTSNASSERLYYKGWSNGTNTGWKGLAFLTDNVNSATKLANTRTIWGQNFNGEANVAGAFMLDGLQNSQLSIYNNGNSREIQSHNGYLSLNPGGNNVLIGTRTNSIYLLDINGTFRSVGAAYLNSTLAVTGTSTLTGLLTANGGITANDLSTLRGISVTNGSYSKGVSVGSNSHLQMDGVVSSYTYNLPATIGWYRVAVSPVGVERPFGQFDISWTLSSYHGSLSLTAGTMYASAPFISQTAYSNFGTCITKSRIVYNTSYSGNYAYVEVYNETGKAVSLTVRGYNLTGWNLYSASTVGSIPSGYSNKEILHTPGYFTSGNVVALGEITAYGASDVRLKTEVVSLTNSLQIIQALNPVSYKWNSIAKELNPMKGNDKDFGLIAQELETVVPELVHGIYGGQYKSIDYIKLIPHLICAIKQLKMEIDTLKNNNIIHIH